MTLQPLPPVSFAKNDVGFIDPTGVDHDALGVALNKALYNYMVSVVCLDVRMQKSLALPSLRRRSNR